MWRYSKNMQMPHDPHSHSQGLHKMIRNIWENVNILWGMEMEQSSFVQTWSFEWLTSSKYVTFLKCSWYKSTNPNNTKLWKYLFINCVNNLTLYIDLARSIINLFKASIAHLGVSREEKYPYHLIFATWTSSFLSDNRSRGCPTRKTQGKLCNLIFARVHRPVIP